MENMDDYDFENWFQDDQIWTRNPGENLPSLSSPSISNLPSSWEPQSPFTLAADELLALNEVLLTPATILSHDTCNSLHSTKRHKYSKSHRVYDYSDSEDVPLSLPESSSFIRSDLMCDENFPSIRRKRGRTLVRYSRKCTSDVVSSLGKEIWEKSVLESEDQNTKENTPQKSFTIPKSHSFGNEICDSNFRKKAKTQVHSSNVASTTGSRSNIKPTEVNFVFEHIQTLLQDYPVWSLSRHPCYCTRTNCLKRYCCCFVNSVHCNPTICKCRSCYNTPLGRSGPWAVAYARNYASKQGQVIFCTCKRLTKCLKRYCRCYNNNTYCTMQCRCTDCENIA